MNSTDHSGDDGHRLLALLCKVPTVIEREALLHALREAGVQAVSPGRDMIVNFANEQNLSLEGYSSFFDGYQIRLPEEQIPQGKEVLEDFRRRSKLAAAPEHGPLTETRERDAFRRFLACALWSIVIPFFMNLASLWWLAKAGQSAWRRPWALTVGLGINALAVLLAIVLLRDFFSR